MNKWTPIKPTEMGYYWIRRMGTHEQIVEVQFSDFASPIVNFVGTEDFLSLSDMWFDSVEWQGPLTP